MTTFDPITARQLSDIQHALEVVVSKLEALEMAVAVERGDGTEALSLVGAANCLSVSVESLEALVKTGEIVTVRVGRRVLVPRESIRRWVHRQLDGAGVR